MPPPCNIGQDTTAAQHRARLHRRAASGRKPPPRRPRPAASEPRTHDFHVHPSYLPSTHKFEFRCRFKPSGNLALINFKTSEDANRLRLLFEVAQAMSDSLNISPAVCPLGSVPPGQHQRPGARQADYIPPVCLRIKKRRFHVAKAVSPLHGR